MKISKKSFSKVISRMKTLNCLRTLGHGLVTSQMSTLLRKRV